MKAKGTPAAKKKAAIDFIDRILADISLSKSAGRKHEEPWTKVTVVLFTRQIAWLDHLAANIRAARGTAVSRAEIIRALIEELVQSGERRRWEEGHASA